MIGNGLLRVKMESCENVWIGTIRKMLTTRHQWISFCRVLPVLSTTRTRHRDQISICFSQRAPANTFSYVYCRKSRVRFSATIEWKTVNQKKRKRRGKDKSDGVSSGVAKYFIFRFKMSISVRESYQSWLQVRVPGLPTAIKKSKLLSR